MERIYSRTVGWFILGSDSVAKFNEVEIPESILDTKSWLSDREVVEIFYKNVDPKILEQIDKEDEPDDE